MSDNNVLDVRLISALRKMKKVGEGMTLLNSKMEDINRQLRVNVQTQKAVNEVLSRQKAAWKNAVAKKVEEHEAKPRAKLRLITGSSLYD